jgi:hypothetical protein
MTGYPGLGLPGWRGWVYCVASAVVIVGVALTACLLFVPQSDSTMQISVFCLILSAGVFVSAIVTYTWKRLIDGGGRKNDQSG